MRKTIIEGVEDLTTLSVSAASSIPLMSSWSEAEFIRVEFCMKFLDTDFSDLSFLPSGSTKSPNQGLRIWLLVVAMSQRTNLMNLQL